MVLRPKPVRRGRRAGSADTRGLILESARALFAEQGYEATSLRQVARRAGVDPALLHHYFDGKDGLLAASVTLPADPAVVLAPVAALPAEERGEALVRTLLGLWDSPLRPALQTLVRTAIGSKPQAALLREVFSRRILSILATGMDHDPEHARLRSTLVASQVLGLCVNRYILELEPLASLSSDEVVRLVAPTLQHYLTGELGTARN